jgi:SAM-dependent methyltransferase
MYGELYDELFRRVPDHPQVTRKGSAQEQSIAVEERLELLSRFLKPDTVFLEIGAGDGALCARVAEQVRTCYALDVSNEIFSKSNPPRVHFILSDGRSIGVPKASVTVAYSYQVMEHIHPDDASEQLGNIFEALAPGGMYLCVTPSRLNGPHDVSRYFDSIASGFHLREYTVTELRKLFVSAGFRAVHPYVGFRHRYVRLPSFVSIALEAFLAALPDAARRVVGNLPGFRNLLFISLCAIK